MSSHGLSAEISMADRRTSDNKPWLGNSATPETYGILSEADTPMLPGPRQPPSQTRKGSAGGYGIAAEEFSRKPPSAPQGGSDFPGFGLAEEAKQAGQKLAGQQTASRIATSQLDRQADVMTRKGAAPMVSRWTFGIRDVEFLQHPFFNIV